MTFARGARVTGGPIFKTPDRPVRDMNGVLIPSLHRVDEREPDWVGQILIEGREFQLQAWKRPGAEGGQFLKLRALRLHR